MNEADSVRGGTGRAASTLELFFDLVYVFAITQVVGLIHGDPTAKGLAKGALLLLILWWTWSIYTWTTNWTGTDSVPIKLFLLATMGARRRSQGPSKTTRSGSAERYSLSASWLPVCIGWRPRTTRSSERPSSPSSLCRL